MNAPRTYTAAEKQAAIRLTLEVGPAAASRELGIPSGTLTCWSHKARQGKPGYAVIPEESPKDSDDTTSPSEEARPGA